MTKEEWAKWVILGDPYCRQIPKPLVELYNRIVRAMEGLLTETKWEGRPPEEDGEK